MANQTIKVNYGIDNHAVTVVEGSTFGRVIADPGLKAVLGYGDNVKVLVHGVEVSLDTRASGVSEITLETKANSKAR
jgi:hypothetical protein